MKIVNDILESVVLDILKYCLFQRNALFEESITTHGTQLIQFPFEDKAYYRHIFALAVAGNVVQLGYI